MEECYKSSDQSTCNQTQNISKCTGNISKNTGKFTGETDQIRSGGAIGAGAPGIDKLKVGMFLGVLLLANLFGAWPKAHLQYLNQSFAP